MARVLDHPIPVVLIAVRRVDEPVPTGGSAWIGIIEERSFDMDLIKTVGELRRQKETVERAIKSLEKLQAAGSVLQKKRRGRKFLTPEERREVSARMKKYWAERLPHGAGR